MIERKAVKLSPDTNGTARHCVQMRSGRPNRSGGCSIGLCQVCRTDSRGRCEFPGRAGFCPPLHFTCDDAENRVIFYFIPESGKIQAYKKEAELVNRDFLKRKDVYNMCLGGKVPSSIYEKQVCQYELDGTFIKL